MSDLVKELRGWWNTDHEPDGRGFCKVCSLRSPCDWSQMVDDCLAAADRIEELERTSKENYDRMAEYSVEIDRLMRRSVMSESNSVLGRATYWLEWSDEDAAKSIESGITFDLIRDAAARIEELEAVIDAMNGNWVYGPTTHPETKERYAGE